MEQGLTSSSLYQNDFIHTLKGLGVFDWHFELICSISLFFTSRKNRIWQIKAQKTLFSLEWHILPVAAALSDRFRLHECINSANPLLDFKLDFLWKIGQFDIALYGVCSQKSSKMFYHNRRFAKSVRTSISRIWLIQFVFCKMLLSK